MEFNGLLPPVGAQSNRGLEGFYHLIDIAGVVEHACLTYIIRDHDKVKFRARKELLKRITELMNAKYGEDTVN